MLKYAVVILLIISAKVFALQDFDIIYDEKTKTKRIVSTSGNTPQLREKLANQYQLEGLMYHQEMNLQNAIMNYEIAVRYIPNAEVYADMAECYFYMNKEDSAFVCIERAKKVDSTEKRIYQVLVDYHAKKKDIIKAIEYATYLTTIDTALNTKLRLAYLYQDVNIFKTAEIVEECIKKDTTNSELYLYLMDIYRYVRDVEKYTLNEERYMKSTNKQKKTVITITDTYLQDNNIRSIVKYIDTLKAYNSYEKYEEMMRFIYPYTIYHDLFSPEEVDKFINLTDKLSETNLAKAIKGNLYLLKNDIRKAWDLQSYVANKSSVYTLFSVLANMTANQPVYAIKLIKKNIDSLVAFNSEQDNAISNLLFAYYEYETLRKYKINQYERNPQDTSLMIRIGDISNIMGDNKSASHWYGKALELYNGSEEGYPVILNNYAYFLAISDGDLNIAEKCADKAIKVKPEDPNNLDTYGWILYLKGNTEEAEKYLIRAVKLNENAAEIYFHLAMVYLKQNKYGLYLLNYLKSVEKSSVVTKTETENK